MRRFSRSPQLHFSAIVVRVSILLLVIVSGAEASEVMDHMNHGGMSMKPDARPTQGVVRKVDKMAAKITLAHGPLPNGMPGMTMAFKVRNAGWLDKLREGQKVLFVLDDALTVVHLESAP